MNTYHFTLPLSEDEIKQVRSGDIIYLSGVVLTARDAAHQRFIDAISKNEKLPIDLNQQAIYYTGPAPAKPNRPIGSAGPTSSYRMDAFTPTILEQGVKVLIGKGPRSQAVKDALVKNHALYLSAVGGCGVKISDAIKKCDLLLYPDLLSEAVYRLEVKDLFTIAANDIYGNDVFEKSQAK